MRDTFTDKEVQTTHDRVEGWFKAFAKSPAFAALTEFQQGISGQVVSDFAEYSFRHLDLVPAEWDCDSVCECCLEVLPRQVSAERASFEAIAPVLGSFFRFLGDQSLHPQGHALAEAVEDIAEDIVEHASAPGNWGPAKQLAMAALEAGVNLADPAALNAFVQTFNQKLTSRFRSSKPPPEAIAAPADPYAPCPCGSGKKYKFCCRQVGEGSKCITPSVPLPGLLPFHQVCPELAAQETRSAIVGAGPGLLPAGEYAFHELYCADQGCDCRRVFIQVVSSAQPQTVLASINFGWESESFYQRKMAYDPQAGREITMGSLDPINQQSDYAPDFLKLFQQVVADAPYRLRLERHYHQFRQQLHNVPADCG